MRNEVWNDIYSGEYQDDQEIHAFGKGAEQIRELLAGVGVEPDEGIVQDQHARHSQQCPGQLELAQFAAGKGDDETVQQFRKPEHLIQPVTQAEALFAQPGAGRFVEQAPRARLGGIERPLEQRARRRGLVVDVLAVPAFLQIVIIVRAIIRVAESDVLDILRDEAQGGRGEIEA